MWSGLATADAGVLITWNLGREPDPKVLRLLSMDVKVRIEDLHAEVSLTQVFENLTDSPVEGRYVLPLGPAASVVGFAIWEGSERRRGVIVEKRRGRRLFEELARRSVDPGLLEQVDDEEHKGAFAVRVAPIPAQGTVRVELTYVEDLSLASLSALFTLPLAPRRYATQKVGRLSVAVEMAPAFPLAHVRFGPKEWFSTTPQRDARGVLRGSFAGRDVDLREDLLVEMGFDVRGLGHAVLAYRPLPQGGGARDGRGYFMARLILGQKSVSSSKATLPGRDVILLLDTSLSMQWEKLERAYGAVEYFLGHLRPEDRFTLILFNDEVRLAFGEARHATREHVAQALDFLKKSYLMGGTDLVAALQAGLEVARKGAKERERLLIAVTDGNPTIGEIRHREIGAWFSRMNRRNDGRELARLFILGVGDDANATLLRTLAERAGGTFLSVREGEEMSFKLRVFFERLLSGFLRDVTLVVGGLAGISDILPVRIPLLFEGSDAVFVGRYATPASGVRFSVRSLEGERRREDVFSVELPEQDEAHPFVARVWAKARIDDLLDKIATSGEREEWVNEIVALSKEHAIVTPYTSFLAAARAVLRPRDIQPGDPVLRVKVLPHITRVTALFPFGLMKELEPGVEEGVFETRFVPPASMKEGKYKVTLILTDRDGHTRAEEKTFVLDTTPPAMRLLPRKQTTQAGERLEVLVRADADTRRITLRVADGPPSEAVWDPLRKVNVAVVEVPTLPTGTYELRAVAEDFAHNVSSDSVRLTVVGR